MKRSYFKGIELMAKKKVSKPKKKKMSKKMSKNPSKSGYGY